MITRDAHESQTLTDHSFDRHQYATNGDSASVWFVNSQGMGVNHIVYVHKLWMEEKHSSSPWDFVKGYIFCNFSIVTVYHHTVY